MSDQSTSLRRPFAVGAALLVAVAALLVSPSVPVGAGAPSTFILDPATAPAGDTVTATSDVECRDSQVSDVQVSVTVVDADDNDVFTTTVDVDDDGAWAADIDTSGLAEGTYTVEAECVRAEFAFNYQSETLTLTAPEVGPTTTTTTTTTMPTEVPNTTVDPSDDTPATPPAEAVPGTPSYTG